MVQWEKSRVWTNVSTGHAEFQAAGGGECIL
jgi:hypothetical protein